MTDFKTFSDHPRHSTYVQIRIFKFATNCLGIASSSAFASSPSFQAGRASWRTSASSKRSAGSGRDGAAMRGHTPAGTAGWDRVTPGKSVDLQKSVPIKPNTRYMLATMVKILNRVPSPCFTRGARSGGGYGDPPRRDDGGGYGDPPRRDDEQSGGVAHLSCAS